MAQAKRTKAQRERDLALAGRLFLRGVPQVAIAKAVCDNYPEGFTLSQQQISYDLKALLKRWRKAQLGSIGELKARELARIAQLELEAWDAWERSQQDAETITQKGKGTTAEVGQVERTIQKRGQVGDPSFLRVVQWAIEQRVKILGLNAPETMINIDYSQLSMEELEALRDGADPFEFTA